MIRDIWRTHHPPHATLLHAQHANLQTPDDLARAHRERVRLRETVPGLGPIVAEHPTLLREQPALQVHHDGVAFLHHRAVHSPRDEIDAPDSLAKIARGLPGLLGGREAGVEDRCEEEDVPARGARGLGRCRRGGSDARTSSGSHRGREGHRGPIRLDHDVRCWSALPSSHSRGCYLIRRG